MNNFIYKHSVTGQIVSEEEALADPEHVYKYSLEGKAVDAPSDLSDSDADFPGVQYEKERDVLARPNEPTLLTKTTYTGETDGVYRLRLEALNLASGVSSNGADLLSNAKSIEAYLKGQG